MRAVATVLDGAAFDNFFHEDNEVWFGLQTCLTRSPLPRCFSATFSVSAAVVPEDLYHSK